MEQPDNLSLLVERVQYGPLSLAELLRAFAAGEAVPGSGSANALTAALAACLACSVAVKTHLSKEVAYIHVKQTAIDVERRARALSAQLQELLDDDSSAFAPVIAIRRETGKTSDRIRQDDSRRKEVAALKPATEIPLRIAQLAVTAAELALAMLDSGFKGARGEAYSALRQALASADGALYVARLNVRTIRHRASKLNDPLLEMPWIEMTLREIGSVREAAKLLQVRAALADRALDSDLSRPL